MAIAILILKKADELWKDVSLQHTCLLDDEKVALKQIIAPPPQKKMKWKQQQTA